MPADGINMSAILEIFQVYKDDQGCNLWAKNDQALQLESSCSAEPVPLSMFSRMVVEAKLIVHTI